MKKGQAAVEYLTTYGWAILVLIIVLAVLMTSGILSPNYLISEECNFGTNLPCRFALFNQGGETRMTLVAFNGFPYKVQIKRITVELQDGTRAFGGFDTDILLESGANHTFNGTLPGTELPQDTVKRFSGSITYVSCAPEINATGCSNLEHTITGRIVGRVLPE